MKLPNKFLRIALAATSSVIFITACGGGSGDSGGSGDLSSGEVAVMEPPPVTPPVTPPVIPQTNDDDVSEAPLDDFINGNDSSDSNLPDVNGQPDDAAPADLSQVFADFELGEAQQPQALEIRPAGDSLFAEAVARISGLSTAEIVTLRGTQSIGGSLSLQELDFFETNSATSIIVSSNAGNADFFVLDIDGDILCLSESTDPLDICTGLVIGESYLVAVGGTTPAEYELFSTNTPPLMGDSAVAAELSSDEQFFFVASEFTAANLVSLEGDADLQIRNSADVNVCLALSSSGFDSCNNVDGSNSLALDKDEQYIIIVRAFSDASFELETFANDALQNNIPVQAVVEDDQRIVYFARGVSTIELSTISGDADLGVYNATTGVLLCSSVNADIEADACSVPEGNYRIEVFGFLPSFYSLVAF